MRGWEEEEEEEGEEEEVKRYQAMWGVAISFVYILSSMYNVHSVNLVTLADNSTSAINASHSYLPRALTPTAVEKNLDATQEEEGLRSIRSFRRLI